jgi:hypothetical protein
MLTFIGFIFFIIMIFDSIYEGKAPINKTRGVSRLNTRLNLYFYESRKLRFSKNKNLVLNQKLRNINKNIIKLELENYEYTFFKK